MPRWQNAWSLACAPSTRISRPFTTSWGSARGRLLPASRSNATWSEPSLHGSRTLSSHQGSTLSARQWLFLPRHTSVYKDGALRCRGAPSSQQKYVVQYVVSPIYGKIGRASCRERV